MDTNWPLDSRRVVTATGAVSASSTIQHDSSAPVAPAVTIPRGPGALGRSASMSTSKERRPATVASLSGKSRSLSGAPFLSLRDVGPSSLISSDIPGPVSPGSVSIARAHSSPLLQRENLDQISPNHHNSRVRRTSQERERESLRELVEFFRTESPPRSNLMSRGDEFQYSSASSPRSSSDNQLRRDRRLAFPLLNAGKWDRLKSMKNFKKSKNKRRRSNVTEIKLPDSAVAGTTIGGHRHIAISIPVQYCHLGPSIKSQYPVYIPTSIQDADKQQTRLKQARQLTGERTMVSVLKPVVEDRESVSSLATQSQTNCIDSLDGSHDATALRPRPQQEGETNDSLTAVEPVKARISTVSVIPSDMDFVNAADDGIIHRPEVWIPKATHPRKSQDSNPESLNKRTYIPHTGNRASIDKENQCGIQVPCRQSSVKRGSGSVAEAPATLSGSTNPLLNPLAEVPVRNRPETGRPSEDESALGYARIGIYSNTQSIASKTSEASPGMVSNVRLARIRPATMLLDSAVVTSTTTPPETPLLVDFPSPPGFQQMFVDLEPAHVDKIAYAEEGVDHIMPLAPPSSQSRADLGLPLDPFRHNEVRKTRVKVRNQKNMEETGSQERSFTTCGRNGGNVVSRDLLPESPIVTEYSPSTAAAMSPNSRRAKSTLSLTPVVTLLNVEPASPLRPKTRSFMEDKQSLAILTSPGPSLPGSPANISQDPLRIVRPSTSLPLDRTSLARRRELREFRDWLVSSQKPESLVSGTQTSSTSTSRDRLADISEIRSKISGPLRSGRRVKHSEFADAHDSLTALPRSELLGRYEALRDRHIRDTERRLRRLEKNGDMWLKNIAPLLENLNQTLANLRPNDMRPKSVHDSFSSGEELARTSVKEWRKRRRGTQGVRHKREQNRCQQDAKGQSLSVLNSKHPEAVERAQSGLGPLERVISTSVESTERRSSTGPSLQSSKSTVGTPSRIRVPGTGNNSKHLPIESNKNDEEDTGNQSQTSGMETLEPLMRELQGAARLSLADGEVENVQHSPLMDERSIFENF